MERESMFKFLHTADIHLDSPQLNLDQYDGAPTQLRNATRRAFDNVVELAIREQVRFVLIAGDLYDGDCRDFNTPLHLRRKLNELDQHGIRVFIVQGNHDAENRMRKAFSLQLPSNVCLLGTSRPETHRIDDLQVAIHGQGFAARDVTENLSANYPSPERGWLNIGMLHTSCGVYEAHARYAPSTIGGLTRMGYDYWALGHIHKRETLAGPEPWIVYPGNPQGRHVREAGPRGCAIVMVEADRVSRVQWHDTDVLRWHVCNVDASEYDDPDAILAATDDLLREQLAKANGRPLAVRIEVYGATKAHRDLVRHAHHWQERWRVSVLNQFDDQVWVEKIHFRTRAQVSAATWQADDPIGQLLQSVAADDAFRAAWMTVREEYELLRNQLPTDPRLVETATTLDEGPSDRAETLFAEAKELLLGSLLQSEGNA
jgi:DNA repair exonuclease SbcCD nuclease subunit